MIYFPSCKINLGLHILSKREDGYHDLESGMLEIPVSDALEMIISEEFAFSSSGLQVPGDGNLCVDAYRMLQSDFKLGEIKMHLQKNIPMGAGLGGGSSDAAFVLKLTNQLFNLNLDTKILESYASGLGSDCAFFIKGGFQLARGRGEILTPLHVSLSGYWVVLINPGIHVSTGEAFSKVKPDSTRAPVSELLDLPVKSWKDNLINDFEESVFSLYPAIGEIKESMYKYGAVYASMSGSGSTVYGIFEQQPLDSELLGGYAFMRVFQL